MLRLVTVFAGRGSDRGFGHRRDAALAGLDAGERGVEVGVGRRPQREDLDLLAVGFAFLLLWSLLFAVGACAGARLRAR